VLLYGLEKEPYKWHDFNWKRGRLRELVIYETSCRHFLSLNALSKVSGIRLRYLLELGINCIELLPVYEFRGPQGGVITRLLFCRGKRPTELRMN
jgi:1,4-alpha-glucan branching enzyme